MSFDPILADIRFGCGLSPDHAPPASVAAMLTRLQGPDEAARAFPIEDFPSFRQRMIAAHDLRRQRRQNRGTDLAKEARKGRNILNREARLAQREWLRQHLRRRTATTDGFRERLTFFWGDHFTVLGKAGVARRGTSPYFETAIRPHVAGRFGDMLKSAVTHPMMTTYLDQFRSIGPNSPRAGKSARDDGLNENLAREVLELHTLGVGGPYTQADVRQLAELFTGLTFQVQVGAKFRRDFAEPGAETVLGRDYGGGRPSMADIHAVLDDLAVHPATAAHLARKLAQHFVSDNPDAALVSAMTDTYMATGGALLPVYETLLTHPAAWDRTAPNAKRPFDFIASACRALAVRPAALAPEAGLDVPAHLMIPMAQMGQPWERPGGPDGWPEEDGQWITPQGLAARLRWSMIIPPLLRPDLPDPRDFVIHALGPDIPDRLRFVARAAETRWEGVGLILASPAFQRL